METHVGAVRVGKLDGDFVVNPDEESLEDLEMDLIVSGSDDAILMVECGAEGVTEAEVLDALDIAHGEIKKIVASIEELRGIAGKDKIEVEVPKVDEGLLEQIKSSYGAKLDEATQVRREAGPPGRDQGGRGRGPRRARPRADDDEEAASGAPRSARAFASSRRT